MTSDEYWNGDCDLVRGYVKAEELRLDKQNYQAWLQGQYFYDGLCLASPIFNDFAKPGTKAKPYHEKPYPKAKKLTPEEENEEKLKNGVGWAKNFVASWNKRFKEKQKKGGEDHGK